MLGDPLWRVRGSAPEARSETVCSIGCGGGFDPFGWLVRLFSESNDGGGERSTAGQPEPAAVAKTETLPGGPDREVNAAASSALPDEAEPRLAEAAAAALPAESGPPQSELVAGDLRTGEVVARIWIAPFVDADGVYREASWIRVVLEPAGWRLK